VNEVSCETLNKFIGEEEMKKMFIGGLVVCLMMGLFVGCNEKPEEESGDNPVGEQFWGRYNVTDKNHTNVHYVISKNKIDSYSSNSAIAPSYSFTARTEGKNLHIMANIDKNLWTSTGNLKDVKIGYFEDNKLILNNYMGGFTSTNPRTAEKVQE
jgi:hypothetical protein